MQLFINPVEGSKELYDLIRVTDTSYTCLLQGTLEEVLIVFKDAIRNQDVKSDHLYEFDSKTQMVMDYTDQQPVVMLASTFAR
jgi:hypothetical protein